MLKSLLSAILGLFFTASAGAQYWQQQVNHTIHVSLNDHDHTLDGVDSIIYSNHSPDTLYFIWFHLWPNAYKNDKTAFSEQLLINNRTDFYFSNKEQRGYINRLDLKVDGVTAQTEDHPQYIDILKLILPHPLPPGGQIAITTPFHVQLPDNFSRGGHTGDAYQLTQWFPKPAVYDRYGWHPMPYLDQGEFYSEFGNYEVHITVPENYAVAATGELQDEKEKLWLANRKGFEWTPIVTKSVVKKGSYKHTQKNVQLFPASASDTKTIVFRQSNVHDFAWFADKRFRVVQDTLQLRSGRTVIASGFYLPANEKVWGNTVADIKKAVRFRSDVVGEYPFNTVTVVEASMGVAGGMEYPTITSISPTASSKELEHVIEHEVGHNWFQGILATNERRYTWMDEGMNYYYDERYREQQSSKTNGAQHTFFSRRLPNSMESVVLQSLAAAEKDQPINTPADKFTELNYGIVSYYKANVWMQQLERALGRSAFDSSMHAYFQRWQFKHPYPEDFKTIITETSGRNVDSVFHVLDTKGNLPAIGPRKLKPVAFFSLHETNRYNYINVLPAIGYNEYDRFMVGGLIHNYDLPANKLQFLLAPLYGTGSKRFDYLGRVAYHWFPKNDIYKIETGISAASFAIDSYQPADAPEIIEGFRKLVPFIKLTLKEKDPLSKIVRYAQFKTFFINENGLDFKTVINGPDTTTVVNKTAASRYLNQLQLVLENRRALYPYSALLQLEQADGFVRAAFTGNYYFNYANNRSGLDLRVFAGKFFYTGQKTVSKQFATDRYQLNMTGANGYEDYTYSNYFVGRNEFQGTANRQIMMRDGGFKVRSDLLSSKIGKTDDWLTAANFVSDLGNKKLPIKIFADIGTYADAWKNNAPTSRFLYDAGLQLSLFHNTLNVYLPLLYNKEFRDYFRSTLGSGYMLKTISFSIDIQNFRLYKLNHNLDF